VVVGDLNCDGRADDATVGHLPGKVLVGVIMAGTATPTILEFAVSRSEQAAVCNDNVTLELEDLDYDPAGSVGPLPGFARSKTCKGLRLAEEECDSIHIYWNGVTKQLTWWRL
jgi:hypothetical protein